MVTKNHFNCSIMFSSKANSEGAFILQMPATISLTGGNTIAFLIGLSMMMKKDC